MSNWSLSPAPGLGPALYGRRRRDRYGFRSELPHKGIKGDDLNHETLTSIGRDGEIRTLGLLLPKQAR
jgi:hypothetical protein